MPYQSPPGQQTAHGTTRNLSRTDQHWPKCNSDKKALHHRSAAFSSCIGGMLLLCSAARDTAFLWVSPLSVGPLLPNPVPLLALTRHGSWGCDLGPSLGKVKECRREQDLRHLDVDSEISDREPHLRRLSETFGDGYRGRNRGQDTPRRGDRRYRTGLEYQRSPCQLYGQPER